MRGKKFDLGILLPNSFRTAWMLWRGQVKRRLGYARGGRSWLLTDRMSPQPRSAAGAAADRAKTQAIRAAGGKARVFSAYQPMPTIDYYLQFASYLGQSTAIPHESRTMQLAINGADSAEAAQILRTFNPNDEPVVVIVPGANFGASKCWLPERFAQVADLLSDPAGPFAARVLIASSPTELPIAQAIVLASLRKDRLTSLATLNSNRGISLGALKEIVRRAAVMVCNDTGPRHFAAALGVPIVTLFGHTDPIWAETFSPAEKIVRIDVPCGPCQLKKCPIDHRCMRGITVPMVMAAIAELWPDRGAIHRPADIRAGAGGESAGEPLANSAARSAR